jgi:hypothetical protein
MDIVTVTIHSVECSHISGGRIIVEIVLSPRSARVPKPLKRLLLFATSFILVSIIAFHPVGSVPPGNLYLTPEFTSVSTIGSTFTVQIKIQAMDQFNTWDIEVASDPSVLNATSLSITGNTFEVNTTGGSAFEIVHCINGKGTGCTSTDGSGIVHSSYGNTVPVSGSGLLFTIVYQIIGSNPNSPLTIRNDQLGSANPAGVPHNTLSGVYGGVSSVTGGAGGGMRPRPD